MTGTIKRVLDRGFGFITAEDGTNVFFHAGQVIGSFDELHDGDTVRFELRPASPKGPRAAFVQRGSIPDEVDRPLDDDQALPGDRTDLPRQGGGVSPFTLPPGLSPAEQAADSAGIIHEAPA